MSKPTEGGVYCRQCHKRRPASHFEDCPDHAAQGPKLTLAERSELDTGDDPRPRQSSTARPRPARRSPPREAYGVNYAAHLAAFRAQLDALAALDGLDGLDGRRAAGAADPAAEGVEGRVIDVPWWAAGGLALGGFAVVGGLLAWLSRQGGA